MLNKVVPHGSLMDEAIALAERISANAPLAVMESLQLARLSYEMPEAELIQLSNQANGRIHQSEDAKEGPLAFVEKRLPVWKGR